MGVTLGIGTVKGAWFARSADRAVWEVQGPYHRGWEVTTLGRCPGGDYLLATGSTWYGAALHRSPDLLEWHQIVDGPGYEPDAGRRLERIWTLTSNESHLYAGVAEAGLFVSEDDGTSWAGVTSINEHNTRSAWEPGLGGLALHRIVVDGSDAARMWVAISAVGVFATQDGGASWELRNGGVEAAAPSEGADVGYCVHSLVADPGDADTIWRQDHRGIYRTTNGGRAWERIEKGIPGNAFGFPIVRDPVSDSLFVIPLESDEYRMPVDGDLRVYRSRDRGESWQASGVGLPTTPTYTGVLRDAMDIDGHSPAGVYFGTTSGDVWISADTGDTWQRLPETFPRITSVKVLDP